ncbi:TPA: terminase [Candidatus Woesearchaeota archaeon]|nr:terminase [Candidatus Woesearchaeota archaeon]
MSKKRETKPKVGEKIADALDIEYEATKDKTSIEKKQVNPIVKESKELEADYTSVRSNLYSIISKGNEAIDGILDVATEGDSPRAYEVAAQMIKTVADANKDLLDLHKKMKDIRKDDSGPSSVSHTNAIYVGSTKELQELVNQSRSAARRITDTNPNIIDVEVEDG